MKWINAKKRNPLHDDVVIVALWREEFSDYYPFTAHWIKNKKIWTDDPIWETNLEESTGCKVLWWSEFVAPDYPE